MEFPKTSRPVIIATKGLPFTDRQTLSARIALWAQCPIFSMHVILKLLSEKNGYGNQDSVPSEAEAERLNQLAFSILCTMAKTNHDCSRGSLTDSPLNCVVIESPLSKTHQLKQLLDYFVDTWIIIVECRVTNKHRWRMRYYEERSFSWSTREYDLFGEDNASTKMWFAPTNWEDAEKAIEEYDAQAWDDYFHLQRSHNRYLRRLVLDPQRDLRTGEFQHLEGRTSTFAKVLTYILTSGSQTVVELGQWQKQQMEKKVCLNLSPDKKSSKLCIDGDCLFRYEDHLDNKATCMACNEELTHQAYTCHFCTLALHKSCAEFCLHMPRFLYDDSNFDNQFIKSLPEMHACNSCKVFSKDCTNCIIKAHLKCRMMPTIINDGYHEHILSIRLAAEGTDEHEEYTCQACGEDGAVCSYFCMFCRYDYHVRCATSPRELEHEHGGYNHLMKLKSSSAEEEEEDYWCDVCCKDMDPECWFYSCQQCSRYVAHMHCVMVKPEHQIYLPRRDE